MFFSFGVCLELELSVELRLEGNKELNFRVYP
jgi:hypothetical protein